MLSLVLTLIILLFGTTAQKQGAAAGTDHGSIKVGQWVSPVVSF